MDQPNFAETSATYLHFANHEAHGRSSLYEELARGVAGDREILGFLSTLPREKRQPNLLFSVVRHLSCTPADWTEFHRKLAENLDAVRSLMLERSTQTNEPARCATMLPVLARLPQPLALIEIGASAGLCLLPDLYGYDYGSRFIRPEATEVEPPIFSCAVTEGTPLPTAMPHIVWRAGLDLDPLDVSDPSHVAWLETLVWPGQTHRLDNLRAAIKVATAFKPRVIKGDLRDDLAQLAREAPKEATLVIFHTAVLYYVMPQAERQIFATQVKSLGPYWIANESPSVFPDIAKRAGTGGTPGRFLLSVNDTPVAWTDPHGASLEWITGTA
ncbi:MAG TPA: DUF2332 domain-containing protein [Alphaproteobacteria bacterium]|nr:DUF2332 domain-containing protein [Alphaproteobacteria bacterium]